MSLGENRQVFETVVDQVCSGLAVRGGILSYVPGVPGLVEYSDATAVSGSLSTACGLLLDDVEAINYFNNPEYRQRNVVPQGSVVGIANKGEFYTDFVETTLGGITVGTYVPGDILYKADAGKVSRNNGTFGNLGTARREVVGKALSVLGSDLFLKIRVDII